MAARFGIEFVENVKRIQDPYMFIRVSSLKKVEIILNRVTYR
jgi:hypothetical protein